MDKLTQILRSKRATDIMKAREDSGVVNIAENAMVLDALKKMVEHDIGAVMVTKGGDFCGILTERDYLNKVVIKGKKSAETPVKDIMTTKIFPATSEWTLEDCMHCMADNYIRHIPVYRSQGNVIESLKVTGMISSRDVIRLLNQLLSEIPNPPALGTMEDIWTQLTQNATPYFSIHTESTVFEAIQLMVKNQLGGVFVAKGTKLVGIFTERDYLKKVVLKGKNSKTLPISEVMTRDIICLGTNDPIEKCIKLMEEKHIRHMPVVNLVGGDISYSEKSDSHVGVITLLEIIRYLSKITRNLGSDSFYRSV